MRLVWTRLALRDLHDAYEPIAEGGPSSAARLIDFIEHSADMLVRHPLLGRNGRVAGTRELVVAGAPFVIAYREKGGRLEVLGVIHGSRKWPDAFS